MLRDGHSPTATRSALAKFLGKFLAKFSERRWLAPEPQAAGRLPPPIPLPDHLM